MILVYLEWTADHWKKNSLEALGFARQLSGLSGMELNAISFGSFQSEVDPGFFGVRKHFHSNISPDKDQLASAIAQACSQLNVQYLVMGNTSLARSVSGQIAVKTGTTLVSGISGLISENGKILFKKSVFSGKAYAYYSTPNNKAVLSITANCFPSESDGNQKAEKQDLTLNLPESRIKQIDTKLVKGKTPLTEAAVVVSAGRGMKDPSNWGMIEELADLLGATTACSRPVADVGWRPHHEHVGQTGIAIRPNVYIAIGISGAIQHLAGVNNSRKIIVINKDPEAPFFKAADYGICGDLFEIVPKLNEAIKRIKH